MNLSEAMMTVREMLDPYNSHELSEYQRDALRTLLKETNDDTDPAEIDIDVLAKAFCDQLNVWMHDHDETMHDGEPCHDERGNILAYIAHRIGYSRETLVVMIDRLKDYGAMHGEHHVEEERHS